MVDFLGFAAVDPAHCGQ